MPNHECSCAKTIVFRWWLWMLEVVLTISGFRLRPRRLHYMPRYSSESITKPTIAEFSADLYSDRDSWWSLSIFVNIFHRQSNGRTRSTDYSKTPWCMQMWHSSLRYYNELTVKLLRSGHGMDRPRPKNWVRFSICLVKFNDFIWIYLTTPRSRYPSPIALTLKVEFNININNRYVFNYTAKHIPCALNTIHTFSNHLTRTNRI